MANLPFGEAVKEVRFCIESGGVTIGNAGYVAGIISCHGVNRHEVFQEAAEQIRDLVNSGLIEAEPELAPVLSN